MIITTNHEVPMAGVQLGIASVHTFEFTSDEEYFFVPEGKMELIIQTRGSFYYKLMDQEGWVERPPVFIGGLHTKSFLVKAPDGGGTLISIKFRPTYACTFCQDRADLFKNIVVSIEDIFGLQGIYLANDILNCKSLEERLELILRFFHRYGNNNSFAIGTAVEACHRNLGGVDVANLALGACLSVSHFRKVFREVVGLSPKQYSNVVRINIAAARIHRGVKSLTDLALELGYFDQAHFNRSFKSVVTMSPGEFSTIDYKIDFYNQF